MKNATTKVSGPEEPTSPLAIEIAGHESTKSRTNVIYRSKCVRNVEFRWFRPLTSNEQVHASGFLEQTCVIAVFHLFQGRKSLELAHPKKDQKANF